MKDETLTVTFAVEALQLYAQKGDLTPDEARDALRAFGGMLHEGNQGGELWLFPHHPWDVELMLSPEFPHRCVLWRKLEQK